MELSERITWLLFGMAIGFVLGYIVARLRDIEEKVDIVDEHVKARKRDERGFMRIPVVADVLYILALIVVVWSAFSAQKAVNNAQETQDRLEQVTSCNRVFLGSFLKAVEPRTTSGQQQARANVQLQKAWYEFVQFQLHIPPYPEKEQREKANVYASALKEFIDASAKTKEKTAENPYPTDDQFANCLNDEENFKDE